MEILREGDAVQTGNIIGVGKRNGEARKVTVETGLKIKSTLIDRTRLMVRENVFNSLLPLDVL